MGKGGRRDITKPSVDRALTDAESGDAGAVKGQQQLADLLRGERIMINVRAAAVLFAVIQTLAYVPLPEYPIPSYVRPGGLLIAAVLALATFAARQAGQRVRTVQGATRLALLTLAGDVVVASAFIWLFAFDPVSAVWAILFIIPLEGAVRFGLAGALGSWAGVTVLYIGREFYAEAVYGHPVHPESISFRMGIALLISLVAGFMARDLYQQRAQVQDSYRELARIDVLRRHLISTLAHDVRGPLTTIRGTFRTLAAYDNLDPERRERLLVAADRQAGRLQYLAADLLDLARLEQDRLDLDIQSVPLRELVAEAAGFADPERKVEVAIDDGLAVLADEHRLEQVVVNLTGNALRYGEPPYRVEARQAGDWVVMAFRDHGSGVPQEKRRRLFEPFATADDQGSVGLGLWVCRLLVEAQGGDMNYSYEPGTGSVFEIRLPAVGSDQAPNPSSSSTSPSTVR